MNLRLRHGRQRLWRVHRLCRVGWGQRRPFSTPRPPSLRPARRTSCAGPFRLATTSR